jgi:hypothetical protein
VAAEGGGEAEVRLLEMLIPWRALVAPVQEQEQIQGRGRFASQILRGLRGFPAPVLGVVVVVGVHRSASIRASPGPAMCAHSRTTATSDHVRCAALSAVRSFILMFYFVVFVLNKHSVLKESLVLEAISSHVVSLPYYVHVNCKAASSAI